MHRTDAEWIFVYTEKITSENLWSFHATDVIPCEPVGTEDRLGTAYVGDDLAAKSVRLFNKTALDRTLSHNDIYDILGSRRLWRDRITGERRKSWKHWFFFFFFKDAWPQRSPTYWVIHDFHHVLNHRRPSGRASVLRKPFSVNFQDNVK